MIRFKEKEFIAPLVGALVSAVPGVAAEIGMGVSANKAQKKAMEEQNQIMAQQAEQQAEANKDIKKTLDKIAEKADNNPGAAKAAVEALQQKQYAKVGKVLDNVIGLGKDVGGLVLKRKNLLLGGTMAGAAMGASSYLADKAVQHDMKKSGIPVPHNTKQKQYSKLGFGKIAINQAKKVGGALKEAAKKNKGMIISTSAFGALPIVAGYASEKEQLRGQINATKNFAPEQRSYSVLAGVSKGLRKFRGSIAKGWRSFKSHPGQSALGWISNNIGQGGGRKDVLKFGHELEEAGKKSGSALSQKLGKFIYKHPKTSLVGSTGIGLATMSGTWGAGEKAVQKLARKVDNNAYAYQDSKNQIVQ